MKQEAWPGLRSARVRVLVISFFFCLFMWPLSFSLLPFMADVSSPFHEFCQMQVQGSHHSLTNMALFCGSGIEFEEARERIVRVGLYHLILFSGLHMSFLEYRLNQGLRKKRSKWVSLFLLLFALMSGWPGRVVRTWVRSLLRKPGVHPRASLICSWLICIAWHPQWIHSLSLHLSAAAGLVFMRSRGSYMNASIKVGILLSPLFVGWAPVHPIVSILGALLIPAAGALWTTIALIEFVRPRGFEILNFIEQHFQNLLTQASHLHPAYEAITSGSQQWGWAYVLLLYLVGHVRDVQEQRQKQRALR